MATELIVNKLPRTTPLVDRPIAFPPLKRNLYLEYLEVKKKLKPPGQLPPLKVWKKRKPFVAPETPATPATPVPVSSASPRTATGGAAVGGAATGRKILEIRGKTPDPVATELASDDDSGTETPEGADSDVDASDDGGADDEGMLGELGEGPSGTATPAGAPTPTTADPDDDADGEDGDAEAEAEDDAVAPEDLMTPEEREALEKEEYIWRFHILRKSNPTKKIPTFTEHDDLPTMKLTYTRTLKELSLDQSVNSYRDYLIGGFLIIENVGKHFIDPCFDGYAEHQIQQMDKYDTLLVELGEKSYNRWGVKLPVELRLLGMIVIQAGVFYMMSRSSKSESGLASIIKVASGSGRTRGTVTELSESDDDAEAEDDDASSEAPKKRKTKKVRKMRGPSMTPEEIKKMAEG